jgi:non-homologous end joining protein Ku
VPNDEIVSGYAYQKGQYVVIDTEELEKLRTESDRSVNVQTFCGRQPMASGFT